MSEEILDETVEDNTTAEDGTGTNTGNNNDGGDGVNGDGTDTGENNGENNENQDPETSPEDEIEDLKQEIVYLRQELLSLEELRKCLKWLIEQINEFTVLFPNHSLESVPEEVWESVKCGVPLAAAFALYEKKRFDAAQLAESINKRNASLSAGKAGINTASEYFTQEQVRSMSRAEVKANYSKIIESMKRWN